MPRLTLTLDDRQHKALRLLALQRDRTMLSLIKDALGEYLEREGGFELRIRSSADGDDLNSAPTDSASD
ncbi:MAG: hypothetical protein EBZ29_04285 [Synechococcaceae bacterium WB9_4xC_028]|nr:hypothetical protein [Synechococcaceae bacterium WB9_4xB_025]NDD68620.1 hypothetical protein [Synechococcaceae bacterium WB9_4xC_028]